MRWGLLLCYLALAAFYLARPEWIVQLHDGGASALDCWSWSPPTAAEGWHVLLGPKFGFGQSFGLLFLFLALGRLRRIVLARLSLASQPHNAADEAPLRS